MANTQTVTILFCDLVGSTALMTRLGDDANDRVRRRVFATLREAVAACRGEEVKSTGDGIMVAFAASAADATSCAVAMQRGVSRLSAQDPLLGLTLRIGVSSGEATHEERDWYGVPVVEAARLENKARPNQILASDLTRGLVGSRGGYTFTSVGALELKGIPDPLPASEVAWEPDPGLLAIPLPSGLSRSGPPFAGRDDSLSVLRAAWDEAVGGERRFVIVTGEDGIGKTRLAAEFAASVHADDVVVLYGRSGLDREIPYEPFAEALRWYVLASQPHALREQVGAEGGQLARLVPALRTKLPELPEARAGDADAERRWLFEAIAGALRAAAARASVLLILDDLELAGRSTLDLLRYLIDADGGTRLMVVALAGTAAPGSPSEAEVFLRASGGGHVALRGLSTVEVQWLVAQAIGTDVASDLAGRIRRETDGNPRWVADVLGRLLEARGRVAAPADASDVAESVLSSACPYMGLRSFDTGDAELYFGREEVVGALLGRLAAARLLCVVGASGSGKSSLVRAGVVPQLRAGALPGSRDWDVLVLTPGANPLSALASALAGVSGLTATAALRDVEADARAVDLTVRQSLAARGDAARVVLVVDQFEEIFTLCRDEMERGRFIDALLYAVTVPGGRTMAIVAMRADFYGEAARYSGFAEALDASHALLGPMDLEDLRATIERPAEITGLRVEPGLSDRILRDVGEEPGSLPLLSHALLETWRRRDGRTLTAAGYAASGGVRGAIAQTAEAVYGALPEAAQRTARDLFVRLTELGEGTEDTRRRVHFEEVVPAGPAGEQARAVITRLADARLLTTSADTVEVAHEALIREWPRLRDWLDEDREGLRLMRHVTESAQAWERSGRDPDELYRGARLSAGLEWSEHAQPDLNPLERAFLDASRDFHEREVRDAHKRARRLRILAVAATVLAVVAVVVGGLAAFQWSRANEQRNKAEVATGEADAAALEATLARLETEIPVLLKSDRRSLAFILAAQAHKLVPGFRTTRLLNRVLGEDVRYLGRVWPSESALWGTSFSPDGRYLATKSLNGLVELRDASTREVKASARTQPTTEYLSSVYFSSDGKLLLVSSGSATGAMELVVFEVPSLNRLRAFSWEGVSVNFWPRFLPDEAHAAVSVGGEIHVLGLRDGTDRKLSLPDFNFVSSGALDPTGRYFAAPFAPTGGGSQSVGIFDATTFELLRALEADGTVLQVLFSPDGSKLLGATIGNPVGKLKLWDATSGTLLATYEAQYPGPGDPAFNASGTQLVSSAGEGPVALLNVPSLTAEGAPFETFSSTAYTTTRFAGEDRTILTWPGQAGAELWDISGSGLSSSWAPSTGPGSAAMSPDGAWFVKQDADGSWARWTLPDLAPLDHSPAGLGVAVTDQGGFIASVALSAGGEYFATAHSDCPASAGAGCSAHVIVWDGHTGQPVGEPIHIANNAEPPMILQAATHLAFHPDEPLLAIRTPTSSMQLWSLATGVPTLRTEFAFPGLQGRSGVGPPYFVRSTELNRVLLAALGENLNISLWDIDSSPPVMVGQSTFDDRTAIGWAPTPTGQIAIVRRGDIEFYEPEAFFPGHEMKPLFTLPGAVPSPGYGYMAFSTDGRFMSVDRSDGVTDLWDLEARDRIGSAFAPSVTPVPRLLEGGAFFTPDGASLLVVGDTRMVLWDLDTSQWAEQVCFAAGRNLTEEEWAKYFPGREYEVACPQWSAKPNI